jgi:hypothetical protein
VGDAHERERLLPRGAAREASPSERLRLGRARVEHGDERVGAALPRGGDEGVDDFALTP